VAAGKLQRQLVREIKAKPAKAAILGVSLLIASYFWVPLLIGRSGADAATQSPTIAAAATATDQPHQKSMTPEQSVAFSWRQLDSWMNADRMMTATSHIELVRNPFASSLFAGEKNSTESSLASHKSTPEHLSLVLTSTVIGDKRATALISGKAYKVGQRIERMAGGTMMAFTLAEIHPRRVVLERGERGEHRYELQLSQASMDGVVVFKTSSDSDQRASRE